MSNIEYTITDQLGSEFGSGLRTTSAYTETEAMLRQDGLTDAVLNRTPPVGVNLQILSGMDAIAELRSGIQAPIAATIVGLANIDGIEDFHKFMQSALGTDWSTLQVVDIDPEIISQVEPTARILGINHVEGLLRDARHTGIARSSQDLVLRDHTGNCCPPAIDRSINREVAEILKPGGISIVNITTSERLPSSSGRQTAWFEDVNKITDTYGLEALQTRVYDLSQLKREFGNQCEKLRGLLLEIEPQGSFVVFGEDVDGHGEWFRSLEDHQRLWEKDGFEVLEIKTREGDDSHVPPLRCLRHNVVMRKVG